MFKKILCTKVQHMPTTEELALYGNMKTEMQKIKTCRLMMKQSIIKKFGTRQPTGNQNIIKTE